MCKVNDARFGKTPTLHTLFFHYKGKCLLVLKKIIIFAPQSLKLIGFQERIDPETQFILESAALVHDC